MATGDSSDFLLRLKAALPKGWFPQESTSVVSPVLNAILSAPAWSLSWLFALIAYAKAQTRVATATDVWLDIIALDYFGNGLLRYVNETDSAYSVRIRQNLLAPKNTRAALIQALVNLTGRVPKVFEPAYAFDTGGYGSNDALVWTGLAYNYAGGYGSLALPFQAFIIAYRPLSQGVPYVAGYYGTGYHVGAGGYNEGAIEYVDAEMIASQVTDAQIYETIADTAPCATIMWTAISN